MNLGDNWKHRSIHMRCETCMYFVEKQKMDILRLRDSEEKCEEKNPSETLGRCRRNAPTMKGWPAVFETDWCGDHKLDEEKI